MKVTLMLADHAQVAEGKLYINGGGWSITGPDPIPYAIAMLIDVPWDQTNVQHNLLLELLTSDGEPVTVPTESGEESVKAKGQFEVGRPPGTKPGSTISMPFAITFSPAPPLPPGGQYVWALSIDGQTDEDWRLIFSTRPGVGPRSMAA